RLGRDALGGAARGGMVSSGQTLIARAAVFPGCNFPGLRIPWAREAGRGAPESGSGDEEINWPRRAGPRARVAGVVRIPVDRSFGVCTSPDRSGGGSPRA